MSAELAMVSFRTASGVAEGESWTVFDGAVLSNTVPWRTFRWYKGQSVEPHPSTADAGVAGQIALSQGIR